MSTNETTVRLIDSNELPKLPPENSRPATTEPPLAQANHSVPLRQHAIVFSAELALAVASYVLALALTKTHASMAWSAALLIVLTLRMTALLTFGLYKSSLRHAGVFEFLNIFKASTLSSLFIFAFLRKLGMGPSGFPLSFFVLDWALLQFFWGALHFGPRAYRSQLAHARRRGKKVVILGAGDAGMTVVRELAFDPDAHCRPVAILDDDERHHGSTICGVPVVGGMKDLAKLVRTSGVDEALICIPSATRSEMSHMLAVCCQSNIPVRTLPTLCELVDGTVSPRRLRNVRIEDLLQREELRPNPEEIAEIVGQKVVLVTGAGGSIGSELSRQVATASPSVLLLLDKSENSLFYIHRELHERHPNLTIKPLLADITSRDLINDIFRDEKPAVVFHAAAHKHVGLLELHPVEAIRNNVLGVRNVATAAFNNGVERFVNISTDKAVNPENYMGLSKKLTELVIQELAAEGKTRFMNVRFGNVAGSTGSVLRLFWDQIQKGEPLQVTDPRATRYFMSIPEAVYLILRAAGQGCGGETFVFEMGEPINIYELAKSMSLMAGLMPGKEVPIYFVGLRDGEKFNEQLWEEWEQPASTSHKEIMMISQQNPLADGILAKIERMEAMLLSNDRKALLNFVGALVPSFNASRKRPVLVEERAALPAIHMTREDAMHIPLSKPDIGNLEIEYVTQVLRTGRLSLGPRVPEFEEKFAKYVGTRFAVATNSGTSALHLAVRALGIGAQDEVITTPFSFVASTNCLLYEGAQPVFVDIDPVTLNLDTKQVRRFLRQSCSLDTRRKVLVNKQSGRTVKAILPVHVFGLPCDMDPILELARQYGLHVIEDSCEALGAEYRGRKAGTFGDVASFAFYPNKQMTTGEGGMIVTNDEEIAHVCRSMRNQGRDDGASWLRHTRLGYNYRLSDLHCAVGLAQLERVEELLRSRDNVAARYTQALASNPHLTLPADFEGIRRSWFVYVVQLNMPSPKAARDRVMQKLRERGVDCQAYFPAIHRQPYMAGYYRAPLGPLFRTETASDSCLALPFFGSQTDEEIEYVATALRETFAEEVTPVAHNSRVLAAAV
jgi:FlaA1/EpsC-like NDP-sugar epimerase/dTDP-4-amino-4,6-dideoxygalactose transaminase